MAVDDPWLPGGSETEPMTTIRRPGSSASASSAASIVSSDDLKSSRISQAPWGRGSSCMRPGRGGSASRSAMARSSGIPSTQATEIAARNG